MSGQKRDGVDLDATMVLAGHWSCEYHLDDHLSAMYECGIVVEKGHSPSLTVMQQKHLGAAVIAAGWVSPAAVAGRDAELESLRLGIRRRALEGSRLGAASALADEWESKSATTWALVEAGATATHVITRANVEKEHADTLRAVLAPVSGAVEGADR